jgi:hypothetical protein
MSEKLREPVYRAAIDVARADLREIADLIDQLRVRQEQIYVAVEALELAVGSAAQSRPVAKPVYAISGKNSHPAQNSQRPPAAETLSPIDPHIKDALRVQALA